MVFVSFLGVLNPNFEIHFLVCAPLLSLGWLFPKRAASPAAHFSSQVFLVSPGRIASLEPQYLLNPGLLLQENGGWGPLPGKYSASMEVRGKASLDPTYHFTDAGRKLQGCSALLKSPPLVQELGLEPTYGAKDAGMVEWGLEPTEGAKDAGMIEWE